MELSPFLSVSVRVKKHFMKCRWRRMTIFGSVGRFNLGTIFQMKNHSIAFEVCHFFIALLLRKITRLAEMFKERSKGSKKVQNVQRSSKVQGNFKGSNKAKKRALVCALFLLFGPKKYMHCACSALVYCCVLIFSITSYCASSLRCSLQFLLKCSKSLVRSLVLSLSKDELQSCYFL